MNLSVPCKQLIVFRSFFVNLSTDNLSYDRRGMAEFDKLNESAPRETGPSENACSSDDVKPVKTTAACRPESDGDTKQVNVILKEAFRKNHDTVVESFSFEGAHDMLFAKGVLSSIALGQLRTTQNRVDRCRRMLVKLHDLNHDRAFVVLRQAIKNDVTLEFLLDRIDNTFIELAKTWSMKEKADADKSGTSSDTECSLGDVKSATTASCRPDDGTKQANKLLEKVFRQCQENVVKTFDYGDAVDMLFANDVLSTYDLRELQTIQPCTEQCRSMLLKLHNSLHQRAFVVLYQAMKRQRAYGFLVKKIDETFFNLVQESVENAVVESTSSTTGRIDNAMPKLRLAKRGRAVCGLTVVGEQLFVLRYESKEIEVYDTSDLHQQESIRLSQTFRNISCMVSSITTTSHACLYISCYWDKQIVQIPLQHGRSEQHWSLDALSVGVTITPKGNLLIACHDPDKLVEYSTANGFAKVKTIVLDKNELRYPQYATQMENGHILLSQAKGRFQGEDGRNLHRICLLDEEGNLLSVVCGNVFSHDANQLAMPRLAMMCREGRILIVDHSNNRIAIGILQSSGSRPKSLKTLPVPHTSTRGLEHPYAIHFDEKAGRLYIGEWRQGRMGYVVVLDDVHLKNFTDD